MHRLVFMQTCKEGDVIEYIDTAAAVELSWIGCDDYDCGVDGIWSLDHVVVSSRRDGQCDIKEHVQFIGQWVEWKEDAVLGADVMKNMNEWYCWMALWQ